MTTTMSIPSYPFLFPLADVDATAIDNDAFINMHAFPSPPDSSSDPGLDFDLESSFTHTSPDTSLLLDDPFAWDYTVMQPNTSQPSFGIASAVSPVYSAPTPASTTLISPKSSISSFADVGGIAFNPVPIVASSADTAEALSNHHLQRYLHYKALAAQAEADARAAATFQSQQDFEAFLATYSMPDTTAQAKFELPSQSVYAPEAPQYLAGNSQHQATMAHAQAQAHLQAHDLAAAQAQQQRNQTSFWVKSTTDAFDMLAQPQQQVWPRPPSVSVESAQSPSFPLTPNAMPSTFVPIAPIPPLIMPHAVAVPSAPTAASPEGEDELDEHHDDLSPTSDLPIPNLHGGGRGYIPGQTPDDPKKRHKCTTCGRAFARAFNLKSHLQTHSPVRSKPHQCPHSTCKRGFSRLHDLERHRQGIHNDGPLVDSKATGVSASAARAQARVQKRATTGTLI